MIIVDHLLAEREAQGRPIGVAMLGAGFMGRGLANQIVNSVPGMRLVAICNRRPERAVAAYTDAGAPDPRWVSTPAELDAAARAGVPAVTDDPHVICAADCVDAIVDVTGAVEHGARMSLDAIEHGKHIVLMNAELDGTIGTALKARAAAAGVTVTGCDGDQPGVQMNLYRFVRGIGLTPLLCGNIKGLQDPYRNPTTQQGFAERWGQDPKMVTSFADGTKISFEQALVANATGMKVAKRGMNGWDHTGHVDELTEILDPEELRALGGIVDYTVGSQPGPGVFVLATHDDPKQRHYLELYKLGKGPLYSFYTPYHLCHFEVPMSVARVVLVGDPVITPLAGPRVDVVTTAKVDLKPGDVLDGFGGYLTYGEAENTPVAHDQQLLLMGLAEGCKVVRPVAKDATLTLDDVEAPGDRLADRLRAEQDEASGHAPLVPSAAPARI